MEPPEKTQIKQLEQVQRNAAPFVLNKPYTYQSPSSVTIMFQQLNWPTLEDPREAADQILIYKVINRLVAVLQSYLPQRSPRYVDSVRFITYHCRLNIYQYSFFPHTVTYWNQLPASINQPTVSGSLQAGCPAHIQSANYPRTVQCMFNIW